MWKQDILEFLQDAIKGMPDRKRGNELEDILSFFKDGKLDLTWLHKEDLQAIYSLMLEAQTFYFGEIENVSPIVGKKVQTMVETMNYDTDTRFPYPVVLYEVTSIRAATGDKLADAMFDTFVGRDTDVALLVKQNPVLDGQFEVLAFMKGKDAGWGMLKTRTTVSSNGNMNIKPLFADEKIESDMMRGKSFFLSWLSAFLNSLLECRNIVTIDVEPPEKLNKKRIRNNRLPYYSYKILEVVPIREIKKRKNAGSVPWGYRSSEHNRFHMCRGHHKTFTAERPLFGKYVGTYWWNPQRRGRREKGAVEKEYKVTFKLKP